MPLLHAGRARAFTLIEQAATLCVTATLGVIALPGLHDLLERYRVDDARQRLVDTLQYARITAVREGASMVVCPSTDQQDCERSHHWQQGYLVRREDRASADIRWVSAALPSHVFARTRGDSRFKVRFLADGSAAGSNSATIFCDRAAPAVAAEVVVSNSGRIRSGKAKRADAQNCLETGNS